MLTWADGGALLAVLLWGVSFPVMKTLMSVMEPVMLVVVLWLVALVILGLLPWVVTSLIGGRGRTRIAPPWVCGIELEPRMQYSATGFAKPIHIIFQDVIRPQRHVVLDRPTSPYVVHAVRYDESVQPVYEQHLYERGVVAYPYTTEVPVEVLGAKYRWARGAGLL